MGMRSLTNQPDPGIQKPTIPSGIEGDVMDRALKALENVNPGEEDPIDPDKDEIKDDLLDDPAESKKEDPKLDPEDPEAFSLDALTERERRHFRQLKKQKDENADLRKQLEELRSSLEAMKTSSPGKSDASSVLDDDPSDPDEDILDTIQNLRKNSKNYLSQDQVQEMLKKQRDEILNDLKREKEEEEQRRGTSDAINKFQGEINSFVDQNEQAYPFIKSSESQKLILQVIQEDLQRKAKEFGSSVAKKNMMTLKQASDRVEAYLEKRFDGVLSSSYAADKLRKKLAGQGKDKLQLNQEQDAPTTLSNDHHGGAPAGELTEEERIKRAIAALERSQNG